MKNSNSISSTVTSPLENLLGEAEQLFNAGKHTKAGEKYKAASSLSPGDARAYLGMGDVHMAKGRHSKAIKSYKRALELDPQNKKLSAKLEAAIAIEKDRDKANREKWIATFIGIGANAAVGTMQNNQFKQQQRPIGLSSSPMTPVQLPKKQ